MDCGVEKKKKLQFPHIMFIKFNLKPCTRALKAKEYEIN